MCLIFFPRFTLLNQMVHTFQKVLAILIVHFQNGGRSKPYVKYFTYLLKFFDKANFYPHVMFRNFFRKQNGKFAVWNFRKSLHLLTNQNVDVNSETFIC